MNLTMPPPMSYPFYMDSTQHPYGNLPWPSNPYAYAAASAQQSYPSAYRPGPPISYAMPFILRQQAQPRPSHPQPNKTFPSAPSYSNTRYNHLKQSTSYVHRHRSMDASTYGQPVSSTPIPKTANNYHQHHHYRQPYRTAKTKSIAEFQQLPHVSSASLPKAHSWHSMAQLHQFQPNYGHSHQSSRTHEDDPIYHAFHSNNDFHQQQFATPSTDPCLMRASTFDQMPIIINPIYRRSVSISSRNSNRPSSLSRSSSSSSSSSNGSMNHSSLQKSFNGNLRTDPLIAAAMEDFQQLRRNSSQSTLLTTHCRDLSRDSLCSESSQKSSSPAPHRSHSSFTSLERLEIRHLIKALKTHGIPSLNQQYASSSSIGQTPVTERTTVKLSTSPPILKPHKSTITEELEQKFAQLRSIHPNDDLVYVKPSLLKQSQMLRTAVKAPKISPKTKEKTVIEIPLNKEVDDRSSEDSTANNSNHKLNGVKPEYAIPIRTSTFVNMRNNKKNNDEQVRSFSFCKPIDDLVEESRPMSMFNWVQYGLTNPLPTGYSSNSNEDVNKKSLVKENIYASEIDVHVPYSDEKDYFHSKDFMTDYFTPYKSSTKNSSIFHDFSRLFSRVAHHEHENKLKRKCKSQQKNNYLRCSIM